MPLDYPFLAKVYRASTKLLSKACTNPLSFCPTPKVLLVLTNRRFDALAYKSTICKYEHPKVLLRRSMQSKGKGMGHLRYKSDASLTEGVLCPHLRCCSVGACKGLDLMPSGQRASPLVCIRFDPHTRGIART